MKMVKDLEKLKPGDHFMLKDIEWVCLDPDYTEYDGQKGIFAIMAKLNGKSIRFCDDEVFLQISLPLNHLVYELHKYYHYMALVDT